MINSVSMLSRKASFYSNNANSVERPLWNPNGNAGIIWNFTQKLFTFPWSPLEYIDKIEITL